MEKTLTSRPTIPLGFLDNLCRRLLVSRLIHLSFGHLQLHFQGETYVFGHPSDLRVSITVHNGNFFSKVVLGGTVGAGESYIDGDWTCDDLPLLIRIIVRNRALMDRFDNGWSHLKKPVMGLLHALNRNTRKGSARNIAAHYDLGNEFFQTFLDPSMMYSSAFFNNEQVGLHEASLAKMDRICRKLDLQPKDHLIEIGSGWGAFAIYASRQYGCQVTTTTISENQYRHCLKQVAQAGLSHRIKVLKTDYRDLQGTYDKLVSIEMIEAVGHQYLNGYVAQCSQLLKEDGLMLIQAITINDQYYDDAVRSVDFIKRYIFPGSFIPSVSAILDAVKHNSDLRLFHMEDFGFHYARTLRHWRKRFFDNRRTLTEMGFSEEFKRMWDFYFSYCEGGFEERSIGCAHLVFAKPCNRMGELRYQSQQI